MRGKERRKGGREGRERGERGDEKENDQKEEKGGGEKGDEREVDVHVCVCTEQKMH